MNETDGKFVSLDLLTSRISENIGPVLAYYRSRLFYLLGLGGVLSAGLLAWLLLTPDKFMATATILPATSANPLAAYSSIASVLGFNLPGSDSNNELFPDIMFSERILGKLAEKKWKYVKSDSLISLYTLFEIEPSGKTSFPAEEKRKLLFKHLRENVFDASIDKKTGIVTLSARLPHDPALCADLVNTAIEELDRYHNFTRRTKSIEEKEFLEGRLEEVSMEMKLAEDRLKNFEEKERSWQNSPSLRTEWGRLNRDVQVSNTIWIELRKQYELVKLNVLKEKTTFDVLDTASIPAVKYFPRRTVLLIIGMIGIGLFVMIAIPAADFLYRVKSRITG